MSETYDKKQILEKLNFLEDEPRRDSGTFRFDSFSEQLAKVITDPNTPTPYVIGLHGEWGSGKTSLIGHVYDILEKWKNNTNKKRIWFDAWEYERIDPVAALLQKIASKYASNTKFKRAIKGLAITFSDIALRANTGLSFEEVKKNFESAVKDIPTITEQLKELVKGGRLIVFIDDLDRCLVENSLRILESIKLFLNSKGVIFVIAVDMQKIERAWALRYNKSDPAIQEGKDHVEKIFQLKLSLPPKEKEQIEQFVKELASSLPEKIRNLVVNGCPHNPRKIKRILNLIYFLAKEVPDENFNEQFPLIVFWSILTSSYPDLARIIEKEPNSSIQIGIAVMKNSFDSIKRMQSYFQEIRDARRSFTIEGGEIIWHDVYRATLDALELIIRTNNLDAFNLAQEFQKFYTLEIQPHSPPDVKQQLERYYSTIGKNISEVIYRAGLIG